MIEFESLMKEVKKEKINAFLVNQHGKSVFEYYKNNKQRDKLHKVNSCKKACFLFL